VYVVRIASHASIFVSSEIYANGRGNSPFLNSVEKSLGRRGPEKTMD